MTGANCSELVKSRVLDYDFYEKRCRCREKVQREHGLVFSNIILKMHFFFQQAGNFSSFQLEGVLKRGKLNQRLDELRKEMNNRNSGELAGVAPQDSGDKNAAVKSQKILSEDSAHYILIKNNEREPEKDNQEAGKRRSCMQLILRIAYFFTLEIDYFSSFFSDKF